MNTKFFLLTGAALLGISGAANAAATSTDMGNGTLTSGPYFGVQGGYGWTDADVSGGPSADVDGWDYGLFAGYQLDRFFNDAGMGLTGSLEGFYDWSNADDTVGGVKVEKNHEWGVNFRPGLTFIDAYAPLGLKPYGIVGYRRAEFEGSTATAKSSDDYNGFELGIGTELVAYQNYGIRFDYSHVFYGEKNGIDPDEDDVRMGIAYHF